MDNHLGNNEKFSILPGHKSSRHSPLIVKFPVGHISVAGNKEKHRKARPCAVCNPPPPPPLPPLIFVWLECARCRWRSRQDYFPLFPLVNSSFGNNENSAIARKCARAVRSRYNSFTVPVYTALNDTDRISKVTTARKVVFPVLVRSKSHLYMAKRIEYYHSYNFR